MPAGVADAVGPRGLLHVPVKVGGLVGAGAGGLRVHDFGRGVAAAERGDVVIAVGPAVGLFGAEEGRFCRGVAFGCGVLLSLRFCRPVLCFWSGRLHFNLGFAWAAASTLLFWHGICSR